MKSNTYRTCKNCRLIKLCKYKDEVTSNINNALEIGAEFNDMLEMEIKCQHYIDNICMPRELL